MNNILYIKNRFSIANIVEYIKYCRNISVQTLVFTGLLFGSFLLPLKSNAETVTLANLKKAKKHDQVSIDNRTWNVVRTQVVAGDTCVFLALAVQTNYNNGEASSFSKTSTDYNTSLLRTRMTNYYNSFPTIKAIANKPNLTNTYSLPTTEMAGSQTVDIMFAMSYTDAVEWNGGKITPLSPPLSNYGTRFWLRTPRTTTEVYGVYPGGKTIDAGLHYISSIIADVPAVWVNANAVARNVNVYYVDSSDAPIGAPNSTTYTVTVGEPFTMIYSNVPTIANYEYVAWKKGISGTPQSSPFPNPTLLSSEVIAGKDIYLIYNMKEPEEDDINIIEVEICAGNRVTFTATPINGGSSPTWQWRKNGEDIIGATYDTYSYYPENNDTISCLLTSNANCAAPKTVISDVFVIKANPLNTIALTSAVGTDDQILCFNTAIINITYSTVGASGASVSGLPNGVTGNWANNVVTIIGSPIESGTFNYTVNLLGGCPISKTGNITVNPLSTADLITANDVTLCRGEGTTITVTAPSVTGTPIFKWYASANAPNSFHTGNSYTTGNLNNSATYYVAVEGNNYCEGERKAVTVTVNQYANAKSEVNIEGITTICENSETTLTATVSNGSGITNPVFKWYSDDTQTATLLHTGSEYNIQALTETTIFYVSVEGDGYCESLPGNRKNITVTVTPRSTGNIISAEDATICSGTGTTLTANATDVTGSPTFRWYANATTTTILHTGNTYQTGNLTSTTTYYVSVNGNNYCEGEANATGRKKVTVTVNPYSTASLISISGTTTVCPNNSTTLTANAEDVINPAFTWYSSLTGTTVLSTEQSYTTPALNNTTTYYVSVKGDNFCEGDANNTGREAVTVTVSDNAIPSIAIVSDKGATACEGETVTFSSQIANGGTNPTYQWTVNGDNAGVGSTYSYIPVHGDKIVCELTSSDACANPSSVLSDTITMTVLPYSDASILVTVSGQTSICTNETATLYATANGLTNPIFYWYSNNNPSASLLHTGDTYITPPLQNTTIFYVAVSSDEYCESVLSNLKPVTVVVNPFANAQAAVNISGTTTICENSGTVLTATLSNGSGITNPVFKWYPSNSPTATLLHTGSEYATKALSTTTTFYVSVSGDNFCESLAGTRQSITVTTKPRSTGDMITADDVTVCDGIGAILTASATGLAGNPTFRWYADSTSTEVLYTGDSYQTECFAGTNTYYVSVETNNYCEGEANSKGRKAVTVSHKSIATESLITADGVTMCKGSEATLIATAPEVINPIFRWYNNINQSNPIYTGSSLSTGTLNSTTSFFVSVEGDNYCEGTGSASRKEVVVFISASIEPLITIGAEPETTVCEGTTVTFSSEIENGGNNPIYQWKVNGVNVSTEDTYSYIPANGDEIVCLLTSSKMCANPATVSSDTIIMTVNQCASVRGTVFPFIQYPIESEYNKLFPVVASLYDISLLPQGPQAILAAEPLYTDTAVYYDGTEFIPNTPKYPGYLGCLNNPGAPINWGALGYTTREINNTKLLEGEIPKTPVGLYKFDKIPQADYILVLNKEGYFPRFAKITINNNDFFIEHRELIPGYFNRNFTVDQSTLATILSNVSKYGQPEYYPMYDINGDLKIDATDKSILEVYIEFFLKMYEDTFECFEE
ncbi:MAG: hypothetical protein LBI45_00865 [Bacteroidales bacterium]|jgi:hypothetical protein|nr:hypothetical protein [Bacteroidales bacterium]